MSSGLRVSLCLALLLASASAIAGEAPIDPILEARIIAMGKVHSARENTGQSRLSRLAHHIVC